MDRCDITIAHLEQIVLNFNTLLLGICPKYGMDISCMYIIKFGLNFKNNLGRKIKSIISFFTPSTSKYLPPHPTPKYFDILHLCRKSALDLVYLHLYSPFKASILLRKGGHIIFIKKS
jgi:hypothetical protein